MPRPPFNFSAAKRAITHQDGKGILVTADYGQCKMHASSTNGFATMIYWEVYLD